MTFPKQLGLEFTVRQRNGEKRQEGKSRLEDRGRKGVSAWQTGGGAEIAQHLFHDHLSGLDWNIPATILLYKDLL